MGNVYHKPYENMWQASFKMITDAGDKKHCESLYGSNGDLLANYVNVKMNVTHVRGLLRAGLCLPVECDQ